MTTYKNRLPPSALMGYISPAPHKTGAGPANPLTIRAHNRASGFFTCQASSHPFRIMVGRMGEPKGSPGSLVAGFCSPVRLTTHEPANSRGELSQFTTRGSISWQTANSAVPTRTFGASIPRPKSTAVLSAPIIWRSSCRPICYVCHTAQYHYGCRQFWTTSPTISATFSDCLISPRAQRNKPPRRPCPSGAVVHPVNREVWL
ncbi:ash family protein [Salmonella enterica]|nr:hypothetical protein [Salmonella enterica]EBZ6266211.1 hypothetical protein [Salmonella enterica subsp. enterica serovar Oranienburg]ECC3899321.1 hypothetical protein [Salmonella enterica subsp. enterica]EHM5606019.1 ash family protein [Salmonella enterica subsp. enterica serovar Urbana]EBE2989220.1 hypothetical protein [Salmonella enterica]